MNISRTAMGTAFLFLGMSCVGTPLRPKGGGGGSGKGSEGGGAGSQASVNPIFRKAPTAANVARLVLMKDERKVLGWISGTKSYVGLAVLVKWGKKKEAVKVGPNNTFTWTFGVKKPARIKFHVAGLNRSITVEPARKRKPSVFFVVDRSVYRPGQPLHFVAFLRRMDIHGEYRPIHRTAVEVRVTSVKKRTVATKLKVTSDEFGRIAGNYRFMKADPLEDYTISVPGYQGTARVKLAEFRKSKVKLLISGKVIGNKLRLRFKAVDFLKKPVPGSMVNFEAQVVRKTRKKGPGKKKGALDPAKYVYAAEMDSGLPGLDQLPEDERLLIQAGDVGRPNVYGSGSTVVAHVKADLAMKGKEEAKYDIDLKGEWTRGDHVVRVKGLVVDQNGREQRAHHTMVLHPDDPKVNLKLNKKTFTVGEPIRLSAKFSSRKGPVPESISTVVVMRLERTGAASSYRPYWHRRYRHRRWSSNIFLSQRSSRINMIQNAWVPVRAASGIVRKLTTATHLSGNAALLKLNQPGAYKLTVITRFKNGPVVQSEIGCVVRRKDDLPGLVLKLDKTKVDAGGRLTGEIHSRFAGAKVLLTMYDGVGIRFWKTIRLSGTTHRLNLRLPKGIRYGTVVDVSYVDKDGDVHVADRRIRVRPSNRVIKIATDMKKEVRPGDRVNIKIRVNRKAPVDLVVSVYDQSLLGIAPDRSTDVRDFYLADDRVKALRGTAVLQRRLGQVTVDALIKYVKGLLKKEPKLAKTSDGRTVQYIVNSMDGAWLSSHTLAALLRLCGVNAHAGGYGSWRIQVKEARKLGGLLDLVRHERYRWRLSFRLYGDTLVLAETNTHYRNRHWGLHQRLGWSRRMGRNYRARGDAHFSASANSMYSPSAQAFISHMSAGPAPMLIEPEGGSARFGVRTDFSDSAFWNAKVRTNANGEAVVRFKLPDSLTNWRVVVTAVSPKMHVGRHVTRFRTFKPIMVWPMLPRVFTQGDKVSIYASVHNRTDKVQRIQVAITVKNGRVLTPVMKEVQIGPKSNKPVYWTFAPGKPGYTQILMSARCPAGADASLKRLPVTPAAAEQRITASGFADDPAVIQVPRGVDLRTAELTITLVPSLAADMVDNLDYLVEYPHGCVEQTMSRFLPAIKVAQILERFNIQHKGLKARLPKVVAAGIKRLLTLQRNDGGWGWHGRGRTHEMMTPYALYGLLQAEKAGYEIGSEDAVKRGLRRLKGFIQAMGPRQAADRIYAMYVYAHRHSIERSWWRFIAQQLAADKLSDYALALALEMASTHKKYVLAYRLVRALRKRAAKGNGHVHWRTANFSRWGNDRFEITAAAFKALAAYDVKDALIPGILSFFAATKRGNRWNSTKDTAMVTYAMADYLSRQKRLKKRNHVAFTVNGRSIHRVTFADGLTQKVRVPKTSLRKGVNIIAFLNGSRSAMFRAVLRYAKTGRHIKPMNAGINVFRKFYVLDRKGRKKEIRPGSAVSRGSYILSEVTASASTGRYLRYVLVENPKPSSCEIIPETDKRFNQQSTPYVLREDRTEKVVYHHERTPTKIVDRSVLHAELAGDFVVAPAAVELMYQTRTHGHSGTFHFRVVDRPSHVATLKFPLTR